MPYSTDLARAIVRVEYLLATEPFQSTEETRYYLNGLFIEPHPRAGAKIVATDGHTLSCIYDHEAIVSGVPTIWKVTWKATLSGPIRDAKKTKAKRLFASQSDDEHFYADLNRGPGRGDTFVRLVAASSAAAGLLKMKGFENEKIIAAGEENVDLSAARFAALLT